jgi:hypothetical protein
MRSEHSGTIKSPMQWDAVQFHSYISCKALVRRF